MRVRLDARNRITMRVRFGWTKSDYYGSSFEWTKPDYRVHPRRMANTYSQIYIQIVFAVEGRQNLVAKENKEELHKYITGIVSERGQKLLAIHCMPDHTHVLVGLKPSMALSDLVRDVKNGSSNFVNRKGWVQGRFCWQEGFGAFSYGHSQLGGVIRYIQDQERRHSRRTFRDEYLRFLKKFEIEHDERFVFKPIDEIED